MTGSTGMLAVVGTGYGIAGHIDAVSRGWMTAADELFYLLHDPSTAIYLESLNPTARSLHDCYRPGETGAAAAQRIVERLLAPVRRGATVCAAFAGHPAVFVSPALDSLRRARAEGARARLLPAVSIEDCLFADLGIDPGVLGRCLFEARDYAVRPRRHDPNAALILLQPGAVGDTRLIAGDEPNRAGLALLSDALARSYPVGHEVIIYELPLVPFARPRIEPSTIAALATATVTIASTLYVPPLASPRIDPTMMAKLGMRH